MNINPLFAEKIGYEVFLYSPIFSLLIGIFLFLGTISFGSFFLSFFFKDEYLKNKFFILHAPLLGANILILIFFPLACLGLLKHDFLKLISYLLLFLSLFSFKIILKNFLWNIKKYKLLSTLTLLFFLLCLTPFTHADTLAYHALSAVNLINTGSFSKTLLPIEIKMEGAGETLIALSLISGTEQFANLIQFSGLISIIGTFLSLKKKNNYFLLLSVISTPCFIFFLTSPKPQLMQIANILFIFQYLYISNFQKINKIRISFLFFIIITINFLSKFSFILSSFCLFFFILVKLVTKNNFFKIFFILILIFIFLIVPDYYFAFKHFKTPIIDYIRSPLPINITGYNEYNTSIKSISEGSRVFPLWLIITNNLGLLSTVIGPSILSFLLFDYKKIILYILFLFIYLSAILSFGQASSRFVFEVFIILQFLLIHCHLKNKFKFFFKYFIKLQVFSSILILMYLIFNLLPGSFSYKLRNQIMNNHANGYSLISWVNNNLSPNDTILSSHRSLSLFSVPAYDILSLNYVDFTKYDSKLFSDFIKEKKINKVLIHSNIDAKRIYNCTGKLLAKKEIAGSLKGRNPFNISKPYNAYIYVFNYNSFPDCLLKKIS